MCLPKQDVMKKKRIIKKYYILINRKRYLLLLLLLLYRELSKRYLRELCRSRLETHFSV